MAPVTGEEAIFPLHDHSEVLVIDDDRLGGDVFGHGGGKFLNIHQEGAVAVDINDFAVGAGHLGADGCGIAISHGAKSGRGEETTGMMEVVELAGPHLVLADPGGDDGFPLGEFTEFLDDLLRHDSSGDIRVGKGIFFPPTLDFFPPFLETFRQVGVGALGEKLVEVLQRKPDIGEHGEMDDFVFVEFGSIDIDVHDGRFLGEFRNFACDAVVKADAEGQKEVGIIHGIVGVDGAVHAEPLEGLGIVFRKTTDAHESCGHRNTGGTGKFEEVGFGSGSDDASADVEDGAFGFFDQAENFMEGDFVRRRRAVEAGDIHLGGPSDLGGGFLDVFRDIDHNGAGATGGSDMKGFGHDPGNISRMHHEVTVFNDREGDSKDVGFLKGAATDSGGGNLAGDGDHGDGVHVGIGNASDEVGCARTGSGHHDANFSGGPGVALGHERPALFVAGKNSADLFRSGQGLVEHHARAARVSEDGVDAGVLEGLDEEIASHRGGTETGLGSL